MSKITKTESGAVVFEGEKATRLYQMISQRAALKLEVLGMKHSSGRSVYAAIKQQYGFKGNKQTVLNQLNDLIAKTEAELGVTKK